MPPSRSRCCFPILSNETYEALKADIRKLVVQSEETYEAVKADIRELGVQSSGFIRTFMSDLSDSLSMPQNDKINAERKGDISDDIERQLPLQEATMDDLSYSAFKELKFSQEETDLALDNHLDHRMCTTLGTCMYRYPRKMGGSRTKNDTVKATDEYAITSQAPNVDLCSTDARKLELSTEKATTSNDDLDYGPHTSNAKILQHITSQAEEDKHVEAPDEQRIVKVASVKNMDDWIDVVAEAGSYCVEGVDDFQLVYFNTVHAQKKKET